MAKKPLNLVAPSTPEERAAGRCLGKDGFETKEMAEKVRKKTMRSRGSDRYQVPLCSFRCKDCGYWHLGSKLKKVHK